MICPVMSRFVMPVIPGENVYTNAAELIRATCVKNECAWWDDWEEVCSVQAIATGIDGIIQIGIHTQQS